MKIISKTAFVVLIILSSSCVSSSQEPIRVSETKNLLGTYATITIVGPDRIQAKESIGLAFEEIVRLEDIFSTYKNGTPLYKLNQEGILENVDEEILFVFEKSSYYSELSDGAFDITVKPVLDLYSKTFGEFRRPPTEAEVRETLELVNYKNVLIEEGEISFKREGMSVTVDAIAKGYIIDKAIEVLKNNGIDNALVDIGGDIRAFGAPDKDGAWKVALQNPRNESDYITVIAVNDKAVATSGDYERYFVENKSAHHIVNPKTGYSATELISVTIISEKAIDADALATAVFVLGPERGISLINSIEQVGGLIITENRTIMKSSRFSEHAID